jgi:diguanylate cyclase (GGDEF)-like protein
MAIVLVPIIGIMTWATISVVGQANALTRTERIAAEITALGDLIQARNALDRERFPTQVQLITKDYGIPGPLTSLIMGFNPKTEIENTRADTDAAFASPAFSTYQPRLAQLRELTDDGATFAVVLEKFQSIDTDLKVRSQATLDRLNDLPADSTIEAELDDLVLALVSAYGLSNATAEQTQLMFDLQSSDGEARPIRAQLASAQAIGNSFAKQTLANAGPRTNAALTEFSSSEATIAANELVDTALVEETTPIFSGLDATTLNATANRFKTLLRRGDLARTVLTTTITENKAEATTLQDRAGGELRKTLTTTAGLALISMLIALYFARSISRPLLLLARRADAIRSGTLVGTHLREDGPKEITAVTRAVNELVDNLMILDQQASSLAAGDLDAPALTRLLPGGLGVSMQATVDRLSSSIRNREELQLRLAHQASHDDLTGLPNRQSLTEFVTAALARSHRSSVPMATLFIDLDGFKRANDVHGHRFGDQVLKLCAERLRSQLRAGDFASRIGGDEFVVVAENLSGPTEAITIANRFIEVLSQPVNIENKAANIGASIGIAIDMDGSATATTLMRDADLAVYRAKASGRGHAELFDNTLRTEMEQRSDVENAIVVAIDNNQLRLDYQPIVLLRPDGAGSTVSSVEALIRWDRPGVGLVRPDYFIPLLETSPRIIDLGRWVLATATQQLRAWSDHDDMKAVSIGINISSRHLVAASFVADVTKALDGSGIDPSRVILEITETSLLDNVAVAAEHLAAVRALGIRIALDDFGTGFTSIRQLGQLPIDILKIDRSFVAGICESHDRTIVEMMVGVGKALELVTVAEGVETAEQAAILSAMGCMVHQGYFHHRPVGPNDLLERIAMTGAPVR